MSAPALALPLQRTQISAIVWAELRKNFITKRGFWIYLLAAAPVAIVWMHSLVAINFPKRVSHDLARDTTVMATMFQVFFLRPAVYFGCVGIFTYLFRGEMVERSLHYYFLSPVRRELIVLAKYLAGLITAAAFFGTSLVLSFAGMYAHFPWIEVRDFLFNNSGLTQLLCYYAGVVFACAGWGAVFTFMGIRFRNPIVPAVVLLLWEGMNNLLPWYLQKLSVFHFLQSFAIVHADLAKGPAALFGITLDPVSLWVAIPSLLLISAGVLALAMRQIRTTEISYSSD